MSDLLASYPDFVLYLAIAVPVLIYILGVWMGASGSLVVYRNFNDVMLVGLLFIVPVIAASAFFYVTDIEALHMPILYVVLTLEALFLLLILVRTWRDNSGLFSTLLALYVKLPTGILFFFHLFTVFSGDSRQKRRQSIFWTIMLLPLLYALVKDKSTGFLPRSGRGSHL